PRELMTNVGPLPAAGTALALPGQDGVPELDSAPGGSSRLEELLFPWGARGVPMAGSVLADLDRLVWGPCPGRQAPAAASGLAQAAQGGWGLAGPGGSWAGPAGGGRGGLGGEADRGRPTLFESGLQTVMGRPL